MIHRKIHSLITKMFAIQNQQGTYATDRCTEKGLLFYVDYVEKLIYSTLPIIPLNNHPYWVANDKFGTSYASIADLYGVCCYINQFKRQKIAYRWERNEQKYICTKNVWIHVLVNGPFVYEVWHTLGPNPELLGSFYGLTEAQLFAENAIKFYPIDVGDGIEYARVGNQHIPLEYASYKKLFLMGQEC